MEREIRRGAEEFNTQMKQWIPEGAEEDSI